MPFFVPVYLWRLGLDLAGLCLLLGLSGIAFSAALGPWQRMATAHPLRRLLAATFALELLLVAAVVLAGHLLGGDAAPASAAATLLVAALVGIANGAYNAFFWTTQRTLFAGLGDERDSGRRYGNLQIVVAVFLKVGILAGGVLVERELLGWALLASAAIALATMRWIAGDAGDAPLHAGPRTSWRASLAYRDRARSASAFAVDGPFLYLESHFWTLSLFLLVSEDSARLGVVVVALAVLFALLFLLVRSRIDRSAVDGVYRASVMLYALSWLLRVAVDDASPAVVTLSLLVAVTFCSSLFRLAFNKRFFDVAARGAEPVAYLVAKSHVSQLWIALVFLPLAAVLAVADAGPPEATLDAIYVAAAALSLVYLRYRRPAATGVAPG